MFLVHADQLKKDSYYFKKRLNSHSLSKYDFSAKSLKIIKKHSRPSFSPL